MHPTHTPTSCDDCPARVVCRCLGVTEEAIREALVTLDISSIYDLRAHTNAGAGCMACHSDLRRLVADARTADRVALVCENA